MRDLYPFREYAQRRVKQQGNCCHVSMCYTADMRSFALVVFQCWCRIRQSICSQRKAICPHRVVIPTKQNKTVQIVK